MYICFIGFKYPNNWHYDSIKQKSVYLGSRALIAGFVLILAGAIAIWYLFTLKFDDTAQTKADFTVNALDFIHEFEKGDTLANTKYAEKIIVVTGVVTEIEKADTTINLKMADVESGSYIIFAFQKQNMANNVKEGDKISIKGSCSGGSYSEILGTEFISFKRCIITK